MGLARAPCTAAHLLKALAESPREDGTPGAGSLAATRGGLMRERGEVSHAVWLLVEAALQGRVEAQTQLAAVAEEAVRNHGPSPPLPTLAEREASEPPTHPTPPAGNDATRALWKPLAAWAWSAASSQGSPVLLFSLLPPIPDSQPP